MNQRTISSPLFLVLVLLMGIGLMQVYSSSYIFATESFSNGLFFFERQMLFVGLALAVMIGVSQVPLELFRKWGWVIWVLAGIGVALTLIPGLGIRVGGAARWLQGPFGFRVEPSEVLKLTFPVVLGCVLIRNQNILSKVKWPIIAICLLAPLPLLLKQPDFGSFAIITSVALALLFVLGLKWRYVIGLVALAIPMMAYLIMAKSYRRDRMLSFLDPWADPEAKGFQVIQSMLSFHSGGIFGVGIGQGQGKLFFLPEAHTDFTLAVFGEEFGFLGFAGLLFLYGFVIYRGFQIGARAESMFDRVVAYGITCTFALSIFINVGVVLGMLPTKGLTLPFLSYGGSSLMALALSFGLLLNIERNLPADSRLRAR